MNNKTAVPDAWDDDWQAEADKDENAGEPAEPLKVSKADRLAQHTEQNRKLWESADSSETFHFLEAKSDVPLKSDFKPAVKLLSRKPTPKLASRPGNASGIAQLQIDDDQEDDNDETINKTALSPEEMRRKAQRDREEKQRRYDEVRERLFGAPGTGSEESSPRSLTPPNTDPKAARGKGKGRNNREGRPPSSSGTEQNARNGITRVNAEMNEGRQLYDPEYTVKATSSYIQKRNQEQARSSGSSADEKQPIRAPRGPDGSGRGGFGFVGRGRGAP